MVSKVSSSLNSWRCSPLVPLAVRRTFVVKAESNSEDGAEASDTVEETALDGVEEVSEAEEVLDSDATADEPNPPRKPRVKLGDIMGVKDPFPFLFVFVSYLVFEEVLTIHSVMGAKKWKTKQWGK